MWLLNCWLGAHLQAGGDAEGDVEAIAVQQKAAYRRQDPIDHAAPSKD